ncbi:hypothetical protein [Pseudidiomarina insulisalsae]|uniref:Uncharacterized protein n=1 Tax=Pseudidiomarina insulisalsae TaxID=575789 RepID=A0A432YA76_9GAMM|nr:hypothetical protein [Pseudidiomarina insulisalsae]RUO57885.1 hypothetical protein CWI71_11390 [Pseudidiomarina insulisalsae]
MWLCSQLPWRWLRMSATVWGIDPHGERFCRLDGERNWLLEQPQRIFVTPALVLIQFQRVTRAGQLQPPQWWWCCAAWTDALTFSRCRRLALFWRQHRRLGSRR